VRSFDRRPEPEFWSKKERTWFAKCTEVEASSIDPLSWEHDKQSLRRLFHEWVRHGPRTCAYCDGDLGSTSPACIDHFVPKTICPALRLSWWNLFPSCTSCNTKLQR
jgi:5-methylcytosine-specific restriction endonuclease McrA